MVSFSPKLCCIGGNLRHTFNTLAVYSPYGEYLDMIVKLGPLAKSNFCASVSGEEDRFTTHLAMAFSGGDVPRLVDVVANVVVTVVVVVDVEIFVWLLGFEWPPKLSYMYPTKLPLVLTTMDI